MRELDKIRYKLTPITEKDLELIKKRFETKLKKRKMTRNDWLNENGWEGRNSLLSNVFAGRKVNAEFLRSILYWVSL